MSDSDDLVHQVPIVAPFGVPGDIVVDQRTLIFEQVMSESDKHAFIEDYRTNHPTHSLLYLWGTDPATGNSDLRLCSFWFKPSELR